MSTGLKFAKLLGVLVLCAGVLCLGVVSSANAASAHSQRKAKKPPLPPLPSGPQGPVPQIPLDSIAPVPPQVSFQNGQLTIVAPNSTLGDILRAVRKQTGAEIEIPAATDRVVTHLGPGPAREVMAELLNGSRFNYVLLGSPENTSLLTRVVLVAKTAGPDMNANNQPAEQQQPVPVQAGMVQPNMGQQNVVPAQEAAPDANDADAADEPTDDTADQAAEAEQPAVAPDQTGVKTPQQMLQEMQQRQLQLQQQQPPGQPPIPGARPPQEQ
jgi:hypothetical protein